MNTIVKKSTLLRLDSAIKELEEIRAELRQQAAPFIKPSLPDPIGPVAGHGTDPVARHYLAAYDEYAAACEPAPPTVAIFGKKYEERTADNGLCFGCAFENQAACFDAPSCVGPLRPDGKSVIFVEVP